MTSRARTLYWGDLTTAEFASLDPERTIAVLPVAAIEQHGPHLPVATDTLIAEGMIGEVIAQCPAHLAPLFLPVQAVGKSNEHIRFPGTLTLSAANAIAAWTEIGEGVHRAGLRKFVIVNAHGGNVDMLPIIARDLRVRLDMAVVTCSWMRLGYPSGVFPDAEIAHGIHGGDIETSLMLHFRPDLVRGELVDNFAPASLSLEREATILRATGPTSIAWTAEDLHPSGAIGDARPATAEKGRLTARYQAARFIALLEDLTRFPLSRITPRRTARTQE
ncbi:MAG: creatininase family protein [Hyphomicrobiales bacterium]|nr:MAG: creatininase family protein [Hyphomicrobiales bacterium]